ncbi:MAG: hypothetical protein MI748_13910 [Opitutales bacterium]|nr:hypothetical protein [Opitutales bacterium]
MYFEFDIGTVGSTCHISYDEETDTVIGRKRLRPAVFWRKGFKATTSDDLMKATGSLQSHK